MDEQFLHYIWKYQKLHISQLRLTNGQFLKVFFPGNHNRDSGPDFEEARLKIADIEWAGQVEIHINSSDWFKHNHQHDPAYENVILHVVWQHDKEIQVNEETLPTLELQKLIDPHLLHRYQQHLKSTSEILCSSQIKSLSTLKIRNMLDRVLIERLEQKSITILSNLTATNNDWEQVTYRTIATNFGFSTNKDPFTRLSELLPFSKLKKVLQNEKSTEAILFGQAGFLDENADNYQSELKSEFSFLHSKFQLEDSLSKSHWKFGKLRPANFPSVRIAQFAALLCHRPQLFSLLIKTENIAEMKAKLMVDMSEYWKSHYDFGKKRKKISEKMGSDSFENLLINSVAPLLASYAKFTQEEKYMNRAIEILESIKSERNRITKKWEAFGINAVTGLDSQALIQLYKDYCQKRKCLHCNIGVEILNK